MIGENKKIINANYKYDMMGNPIMTTIPIWRKEHPGEDYFDSYLEFYFWKGLIDNNISFELKSKFEIFPKQKHLHWGYDDDEVKILKDYQKGTKGAEKAAMTRAFNKEYTKGVKWVTEPGAQWKPDFFLPFLQTYVDTKGHQQDKGWRFKYKALIEKLTPVGFNVILLQTQRECNEFMEFLKEKNYG